MLEHQSLDHTCGQLCTLATFRSAPTSSARASSRKKTQIQCTCYQSRSKSVAECWWWPQQVEQLLPAASAQALPSGATFCFHLSVSNYVQLAGVRTEPGVLRQASWAQCLGHKSHFRELKQQQQRAITRQWLHFVKYVGLRKSQLFLLC